MHRSILLLTILVGAALGAEPTKPTESYAGAWRLWSIQGTQMTQMKVALKVRGSGWAGQGVAWTSLPENLTDQMVKGQTVNTKPYAAAALFGLNLELRQEDGGLVLRSREIRKALGTPDFSEFSAKLTADPDGLLVGQQLKDGEKTLVLACREEAWKPKPLELSPGTTTAITCLEGATKYHYTVYLPKSYDHAKKHPLLVNSSPGGNAKPMHPEILDELGWVGIGLTESKNGPWDPIMQNRDAALFDLHRRLNIDWEKVYFTGVSGGARASLRAATTHAGSAAGVLAIVAGNTSLTPALPATNVPIFFITGKTDMNHKEITEVYPKEKAAGRKVELIDHAGGHNSGGSENEVRGLRWLAAGGKDPAAK